MNITPFSQLVTKGPDTEVTAHITKSGNLYIPKLLGACDCEVTEDKDNFYFRYFPKPGPYKNYWYFGSRRVRCHVPFWRKQSRSFVVRKQDDGTWTGQVTKRDDF